MIHNFGKLRVIYFTKVKINFIHGVFISQNIESQYKKYFTFVNSSRESFGSFGVVVRNIMTTYNEFTKVRKHASTSFHI